MLLALNVSIEVITGIVEEEKGFQQIWAQLVTHGMKHPVSSFAST